MRAADALVVVCVYAVRALSLVGVGSAGATLLGSDSTPSSLSHRFAEDVAELRTSTVNIAEQLRAFNELYIGKLEPRVVSVASTLGTLHSNVERVLERARVWDALQLHTAAWSDQMHALSAKMDLLSRAQENISALEARLASLPSLDYRLEAVTARLEDADKRLEMLTRNVDDLRMDVRRQPSVVTQFATRGALASLRVVERKLDRLSHQLGKQRVERERERDGSAEQRSSWVSGAQQAQQQAGAGRLNGDDVDATDGDHRGRLVVRCHTGPAVLDTLKDISAKVDVLYDQSPAGRAEFGDDDQEAVVVDEAPGDAEQDAAVEAVDETESAAVTRHKMRRRGRGGRRGRKQGVNSTMEFTTTAATATTTEVGVTTTDSPDTTTSTPTYEVTGNRQIPLAIVGAVECGNSVTAALQALTDAVKVLNSIRTVAYPMSNSSTPPAGSDVAGCEDLVGKGQASGQYVLGGHSVYCDLNTDGGGWTVIQRRGDWGEPRVNFSRSWADYSDGFGDPVKEFWIGNKWLHTLTAGRSVSLRVDLWDWEGEHAVAEYATFAVADEDDMFRLTVAGYSGNASDALTAHAGRPFSTTDANHDTAPACCPCAPAYAAGWWFYSCFEANLNGEFHTHPEENEYYRGIIWEGWRGDYSLRATSMMIRARP